MEGADERAGHLALPDLAGRYQAGQDRLHPRELGQLFSDVDQPGLGQEAGLFAVRAILEFEQLGDFVQAEP